MSRLTLPITVGCALLLTACDQPKPPPPVVAERAPVVVPPPPRTVTVRLESLGLRFEGSKSCTVKDLSEKQTLKERVQCPGASFDVTVPTKATAQTFEQAKKMAHVHGHLVISKEEKTDDGWNIQFHSSDLGTDVYEVWIRRMLGGKPVECNSTSSSADEATKAADACLNLAHI